MITLYIAGYLLIGVFVSRFIAARTTIWREPADAVCMAVFWPFCLMLGAYSAIWRAAGRVVEFVGDLILRGIK